MQTTDIRKRAKRNLLIADATLQWYKMAIRKDYLFQQTKRKPPLGGRLVDKLVGI